METIFQRLERKMRRLDDVIWRESLPKTIKPGLVEFEGKLSYDPTYIAPGEEREAAYGEALAALVSTSEPAWEEAENFRHKPRPDEHFDVKCEYCGGQRGEYRGQRITSGWRSYVRFYRPTT